MIWMYFHLHKKDFFTSFFDASDEFDEDCEIGKTVNLLMDWMLVLNCLEYYTSGVDRWLVFLFCHTFVQSSNGYVLIAS